MSKIVIAHLIKLATDDGMVEFNDDVPIGKMYKIDLSLLFLQYVWNERTGEGKEREMVWDTKGGWLPTECLTWEGKPLTEDSDGNNEGYNAKPPEGKGA